MRDKIKNESYFRSYIASENARIQKFTALRENVIAKRGENDKGVKTANMNLFNYSLHVLIASYSIGEPIHKVRAMFPELCKWFLSTEGVSYSDLITITSLCILFDYKDHLPKLKEKAVDCELVDRFARILFQDESLTIQHTTFPSYSKIADIYEIGDKEKVLRDYLSSWYEENHESYWYESHKSKNSVYFGYWSFESAAIAKVLHINLSSISGYEYFPKDMLIGS